MNQKAAVPMTQILEGNDLQIFISDEVRRLAKQLWSEDVNRAGGDKLCAEVEDHGRGIVVSTFVGRSVILPAEQFFHGEPPKKYRRIDDRSPEGLRQLLAELLRVMEPQIIDAMKRSG